MVQTSMKTIVKIVLYWFQLSSVYSMANLEISLTAFCIVVVLLYREQINSTERIRVVHMMPRNTVRDFKNWQIDIYKGPGWQL